MRSALVLVCVLVATHSAAARRSSLDRLLTHSATASTAEHALDTTTELGAEPHHQHKVNVNTHVSVQPPPPMDAGSALKAAYAKAMAKGSGKGVVPPSNPMTNLMLTAQLNAVNMQMLKAVSNILQDTPLGGDDLLMAAQGDKSKAQAKAQEQRAQRKEQLRGQQSGQQGGQQGGQQQGQESNSADLGKSKDSGGQQPTKQEQKDEEREQGKGKEVRQPFKSDGPKWRGINLAGADWPLRQKDNGEPFAEGDNVWYKKGSKFHTNSMKRAQEWHGRNMNIFRVPVRWEFIQKEAGKGLSGPVWDAYQELIDKITGNGDLAVIEMHNFGTYRDMCTGTSEDGRNAHNDLWRKMVQNYKENSLVVFGLQNEPTSNTADKLKCNGMSGKDWVATVNSAIAAIREEEKKQSGVKHWILAPVFLGDAFGWSWAWNKQKGDVAALGSLTKDDKMAVEVHVYFSFDSPTKGNVPKCPAEGKDIENKDLKDQKRVDYFIGGITSWLKENGYRGVIGEFAVSGDAECKKCLTELLNHVKSNTDQWMGWIWWASGNFGKDYMYAIEEGYPGYKAQWEWLRGYL